MATIDATNLVLGRLSAVAAKRAMMGEKIEIVNCEKALVSGQRRYTITKYTNNIHRGTPFNGPNFPKQPERVVKRTIRGMVPYRKHHGDLAMRRIRCYVGMPEALKSTQIETIPSANLKSSNISKYIKLKDLTNLLGAKNED